MAEIKIERKKKPVWPWLLLLLIIALIAWAIYKFTDEPDEMEADEAPATGLVIPAPPQPLQTFYATV
jgi:hypothetical protein